MMARDQNEEDPKEKIRGKKTEDAKSSPERHRATDVAPFAPRFLARANASRLRVPSPNRFFFERARLRIAHATSSSSSSAKKGSKALVNKRLFWNQSSRVVRGRRAWWHRETKKTTTKKNAFEEKRIYLHGCFDSFGMLRFASIVKESSSSRFVAHMHSTPKKEEKNTTFCKAMCLGFIRNPK